MQRAWRFWFSSFRSALRAYVRGANAAVRLSYALVGRVTPYIRVANFANFGKISDTL
jgi:hypothetical protein